MQVVILCGGQGTRAYPFTQTSPKALMPIDGVPIVEHVMRIYAAHGFDSFVLACGHLMEMIVKWVESRRLPWKVVCEDTGADGDTGDRIYRVRHRMGSTFHATYCDGLGDIDLGDLLAFHRQHGRLATVTAVPLRSQYGLLYADVDDKIVRFEEKPILPDFWINGGFFVFERRVYDLWRGSNLEREVLPYLAQCGELMMYRHRGFWRSMDTYKDQAELSELWRAHADGFRLRAEKAPSSQGSQR